MKKNKIILIFVVAILVLSAFFITKFFVNKKTESVNKEEKDKTNEILESNMWTMTKIEDYTDGKLTTINNTGISLNFKQGNVKICWQEECVDTTYTLENNTINIEKANDNSFSGTYEFENTDDYFILKTTDENNYIKYYLSKPVG